MMIHVICKRLQHTRPVVSTRVYGHFFSSSSSLEPTSDGSKSSLETAVSASKKLPIETTDQPDSVLNLLKSIGFSQTHIKKLITKRPLILVADPNKTLRPNIDLYGSLGFFGPDLRKLISRDPRILEADAHSIVEFFRAYGFTEQQISMLTMKRPALFVYNAPKTFKPKLEYFKTLGFSDGEITHMFTNEPYILERSLENQIIPSVQVIRRVLRTDEDVKKAIKACYRMILFQLDKVLEPNIAFLINRGVPKSLVLKLIMLQPRSLLLSGNQLTEVVEEVDKLGFDPKNLLYVLAIRALAMMTKSLWERKLRAYGSFGLSEDQIISAFKLQPLCMVASEKKIRKLMGFFINELKLKPLTISKNPNLLLLSLEKRIGPRCSVLQLLMSKGMIKGDFSLVYAFRMTHKMFLERYVSRYQKVIPKVVEAHQGKIPFRGFPIELKA